MGYFARIKEFAAVILDYNLEHLNGLRNPLNILIRF